MLPPYQSLLNNRLMGLGLGLPSSPMTVGALPSTAPAMSSGVPEDPMERARRMIAERLAGAQQGIDPRIAAILDRRAARVAEQEAEMVKEKKQTPWEALMRAGAAMASSQSPFFAPGLAAGANAALETIQQRRAMMAKQRAAFGDARDEIEMQRIGQMQAGRKQAMEELDRETKMAGEISEADLRRAQIRLAEMKADPRFTELEIKKAEADIRAAEALASERRTAAIKNLRGDGGGTGGVEARGDRNELDKAAARYRGAAARYEALRQANPGASMQELRNTDSKTVDDYLSLRAELEGLSGAFERRYGRSPYIGGGNRPVGMMSHQVSPPVGKGWSIKPA